MKKLILGFISLCFGIYANAAIFEDGTRWEQLSEYVVIAPPWPVYPTTFYLDGERECDGKMCQQMWEQTKDGTNLSMLIYVEDEKVWFNQNESNPQWLLLYDFGIQPGEKTTIAWPNYKVSDSNNHWYTTEITCTERDDESGRITLWETARHPGGIEVDGPTEWIYGVGTTNGVDRNGFYWGLCIETCQWLKKCYVGDKILYSDSPSSIKNIEPEGAGGGAGAVYDLLGRPVKNARNGVFIRGGAKVFIP